MYEQFYGVAERPFDLTPNPRYLLLTPGHREALANLDYGISARKGLIVLTGEAGTGKTTLLRQVMARGVAGTGQLRGIRAVYLSNPTLDRREFVEYLARGFDLPAEARGSKARFLIELEQALLEMRRANTHVALIVDEAQSLPLELMEEVRLLANIESDTEKLLPVVLVGQPELSRLLNENPLRQLKQRIALRCRLEPLTLQETAAYIAHRLTLAGGDPATVFSREAVIAIYERSRGIPRWINVICDNALLGGFALGARPIGLDVVAEVGEDFDLSAGQAVESADAQAVSGFRDGPGPGSVSDGQAPVAGPTPLRWRESQGRRA